MTNTPLITALLYEHEDGRYAVNPDTTGDPGWHRLGPVDLGALAAQDQEAEPALPLALKTHGAWDGLEGLDDLPDGTEIYAGRPPRSQADALAQSIRELDAWEDRADGEALTPSECESVMLVLRELKRLRSQPAPIAPSSFVNAAMITAADWPATVVRKLDAAFHAATFRNAPAAVVAVAGPADDMFELWWAEHMPKATQSKAWAAWIDATRAAPALGAPAAIAAPDGWKLVPTGRATMTMVLAASQAHAKPSASYSDLWAAMVATAPQAPAQAQEPVWDGKLSDSMQKALNALHLECSHEVAQAVSFQVRQECEAIYTSYLTVKRMYHAARDRLEAHEAAQPQSDPFATHPAPQQAAPQAPAAPAEGEVLVEVSGLTGSGKSAICGEIEIMCRALGLDVTWPDGDPEKNMTHADWTAALEAYKPRVRIVERNTPRQSNGGHAK